MNDAELMDFRRDLVALAPILRRRAMSLSHDTALADDLVQETMLRAWSNRGRFRIGTNLAAWAMTILRNSFFSERRRSGRAARAMLGLGEPEALAAAPARQDHALELRELGEAVAQLPPAQRRVLLMVALGGSSYEEAATASGCSVGTVKSRVSRARSRLTAMVDTD